MVLFVHFGLMSEFYVYSLVGGEYKQHLCIELLDCLFSVYYIRLNIQLPSYLTAQMISTVFNACRL